MRFWWMVLLSIQESFASRILMLTSIGFKSHFIFFRGMAKALIDNGHEVTQVLPFNNSVANGAREVVLPVPDINDGIQNVFKNGMWGLMKYAKERGADVCAQALTSDEFQKIRKEYFDLVLYSEWASHLKVPYIMIQALGMEFSIVASYMGNPFFTSFVPCLFFDHAPSLDGLTLWQRLAGTTMDAILSFADYFNVNYKLPKDLTDRGICSTNCPDVDAIRRKASLLIINSIRTLESPIQPHIPAVIHAGGLHITKANSLSPELEEWVAESGKEGFILFTLGTVVKPSDIPEETRVMLLKVLGSLKQRVLWKWDKDYIEDLPLNVRISKWLPQQDILGHSKLKLFMTHGGLHSTQEAFYNGVPVLGFPVFSDQSLIMANIEKQGWGRFVNWEGLTEEILKDALMDLLSNNKYRTEAQRRRNIARDQLVSPQDTVNYWVEYVIRHNGARHLDSPIRWMPWYRLYNIDVWIVLISVQIIIFSIAFKLLICIYSSCRRRIKKKRE